MALAVARLLASDAIRSALIIDIDLHYGNGTSDIFKDDRRVTFRNIEAYTRDEFSRLLKEAVADAAGYDVIGCSAGFDTYVKDWGGLLLTEDFRQIGFMLSSSHPHFFSVLEGGYYIEDLGKNVRAYLEGVASACS
jgi:acetoin utilization deacetylase AcuC-like enzyme